jgi:hypothetical protein
MPLIRITEEDFPSQMAALDEAEGWLSQRDQHLNFTREELLHAAWTSGHEQAFFQQQGPEAMHHYCKWKSAAVEMSIREVIDGPAGLSATTRAIMLRADRVLFPCGPSILDLRAASKAVQLLREAKKTRKGKP